MSAPNTPPRSIYHPRAPGAPVRSNTRLNIDAPSTPQNLNFDLPVPNAPVANRRRPEIEASSPGRALDFDGPAAPRRSNRIRRRSRFHDDSPEVKHPERRRLEAELNEEDVGFSTPTRSSQDFIIRIRIRDGEISLVLGNEAPGAPRLDRTGGRPALGELEPRRLF
jgi:hypothetical protein